MEVLFHHYVVSDGYSRDISNTEAWVWVVLTEDRITAEEKLANRVSQNPDLWLWGDQVDTVAKLVVLLFKQNYILAESWVLQCIFPNNILRTFYHYLNTHLPTSTPAPNTVTFCFDTQQNVYLHFHIHVCIHILLNGCCWELLLLLHSWGLNSVSHRLSKPLYHEATPQLPLSFEEHII